MLYQTRGGTYNDSGETYYNDQYIVHIPPQSIRMKELIYTSYKHFFESDGTEIFTNREHRIRIPPSYTRLNTLKQKNIV